MNFEAPTRATICELKAISEAKCRNNLTTLELNQLISKFNVKKISVARDSDVLGCVSYLLPQCPEFMTSQARNIEFLLHEFNLPVKDSYEETMQPAFGLFFGIVEKPEPEYEIAQVLFPLTSVGVSVIAYSFESGVLKLFV